MNDSDLDTRFYNAVERLRNAEQDFPPDILLTFFALYKQANQNNTFNTDSDAHELISAFKMNAILQVRNLSPDEAKAEYIRVVNLHLI